MDTKYMRIIVTDICSYFSSQNLPNLIYHICSFIFSQIPIYLYLILFFFYIILQLICGFTHCIRGIKLIKNMWKQTARSCCPAPMYLTDDWG